MSEELIDPIADYSNEPKWLEISWKYAELEKSTKQLSEDIRRYRDALGALAAAGTSIMNGKERIYLLKESISQMESAA